MPTRTTPRRRKTVLVAALFAVAALLAWAVVFVVQRPRLRAQQHIDAGVEAVRHRNPAAAEREWLEASRINPSDPIVWELLGDLYINTEQWSKGSGALKQLQRVDPGHKLLYSKLAACALRSGDETEAQKLAQEELKRNPKDEASLNILAFLSEMQDNLEQQIGYLNRIREVDPRDLDNLHSLAQAYYGNSQYAEVIPVADQILKLAPQDSSALTLRAASRYETAATPDANSACEADLLGALKLNPMAAFARFTLGRVYLRMGRYKDAAFQLELAQQLYPRKLDVPFELAKAYSRMGDAAKAAAARTRFEQLRAESTRLSALKKKCSLERNNFDAHLAVGQMSLDNGDFRQAMYYIQRALVLRPKDPEAEKAWKRLESQFNAQIPGAEGTRP